MQPPTSRELSFLGTGGEWTTWSVCLGSDATTDTSGLPARLLTAEDGRTLAVQKWVPTSLPPLLPAAYDLLENEIRAGLRLVRRYGVAYPPELVRLIGYDADAEQPFILVTQPRGEPLAAVAGQLLLAEQRAFETSLFRALLLLAEADLVHGNLTPKAVRWDGSTVQVADFACAAVRDEPRRPHDGGVWSPAEQRNGTGAAAAGDDIWAGGMLLYHAITGRQPSPRSGPPNLADRSAALRTVLDGVFTESAANRPDATQILQRMRVDATVPPRPTGAEAALEEGGRRFDEARRAKWPAPKDPPGAAGSVRPPGRPAAVHRSWRRGFGLAISLVMFTVVVVAATALMVLGSR